ncbi:hypothetical protein F2P81_022033 [Scophthalmus maximus]|uniref:Uncharacterized protein n=1 Tax=Scophthalmus maximus TaxID=52904 RepID=A0A6A4S141_SCOMX|nr:hypothetical protein F2P81_022033 [Scophthalmus maximus]
MLSENVGKSLGFAVGLGSLSVSKSVASFAIDIESVFISSKYMTFVYKWSSNTAECDANLKHKQLRLKVKLYTKHILYESSVQR